MHPTSSAKADKLVVVKDILVMLAFLRGNTAKFAIPPDYSGIIIRVLGFCFLFVFYVFLGHFFEIINPNHAPVKFVNSNSITLIRFSGKFFKKSRAAKLSL